MENKNINGKKGKSTKKNQPHIHNTKYCVKKNSYNLCSTYQKICGPKPLAETPAVKKKQKTTSNPKNITANIFVFLYSLEKKTH